MSSSSCCGSPYSPSAQVNSSSTGALEPPSWCYMMFLTHEGGMQGKVLGLQSSSPGQSPARCSQRAVPEGWVLFSCPPLQPRRGKPTVTLIGFPLPSMKLVLGAAGCSVPGMQTRQRECGWTVQGEGKHANVCFLNYCCVFLTAQQGTASPAHSLVPWQALKPVTFSPVLSCYLINEFSGGKGF